MWDQNGGENARRSCSPGILAQPGPAKSPVATHVLQSFLDEQSRDLLSGRMQV